MEGLLSTLAVALGLVVIALVYGPPARRDRAAREEMDETRRNGTR
jgi:hypothetical protein